MLSKIRHYVKKDEYAIFESHLRYGCQIWFVLGTQFVRQKVEKLQKKALSIISDLKETQSPLFEEWKILKIKDIVEIQNCHLSYWFLKGKQSFDNILQRCSEIHSNPTTRFKSVKYGLNCITNISFDSWNKLTEMFESLSSLSLSELKSNE